MGDPARGPNAVAWIDFLGMAGRLETLPLPELVNRLKDFATFYEAGGRGAAAGRPTIHLDFFQDTMVLWTDDVSAPTVRDLIQATIHVFGSMATLGWPCRGALAAGSLYVSTQDEKAHMGSYFLVGSSISYAVAAEKNAEWCGIAIHPSLWTELGIAGSDEVQSGLAPQGLLAEYDVPYMVDCQPVVRHLWTVGWPHWARIRLPRELAKMIWDTPPEKARRKYDNTLAYMEWWSETYARDVPKVHMTGHAVVVKGAGIRDDARP